MRKATAFIYGALLGAAAGILWAPRSGKETRELLRQKADELIEQGLENYESQRERLIETIESSRKNILERSEELKQRIQEAREKIMEQVDAATEAAREKIKLAAAKTAEEAHEEQTTS